MDTAAFHCSTRDGVVTGLSKSVDDGGASTERIFRGGSGADTTTMEGIWWHGVDRSKVWLPLLLLSQEALLAAVAAKAGHP